jgi:SAM-dependent methyltransferase
MEISSVDINHLKIIRKNVADFIKVCSIKYDKSDSLMLDIAPQDYNGAKEFFKSTKIETLDIDPHSGCNYIADICMNNEFLISENKFDYILCTEVLEHTLRPFDAANELLRILKPDGLVFVTVPFNFRIHGPLPDCWRFTEHGLRSIFSDFKIIALNSVETPDRNLMPIHYSLIAQKNGN